MHAGQSVILRTIVDTYRFSRNDGIRRDLRMMFYDDVIKDFTKQHENRLFQQINVKAVKLLDA